VTAVSREEFDRALATARNSSERTLHIGALLQKAMGREVIVVGGSAIDVYATGRMPSLDVDLVTERAAAIPVLQGWGFSNRQGRTWRRADLAVDIDLVPGELTGSLRRSPTFQTPYGPVRVLGVEDLVLKRLAELQHWESSRERRIQLVEQLDMLLARPGLDEAYLDEMAPKQNVVRILADFRSRAREAERYDRLRRE